MKILKETKEKNIITFEVEEDYSKVLKAMDAAFIEISKETKIPGFRPGKIPRSMFEKHYGTGALMEKAVTNVINETYPLIVKEKKLEPIDYPSGLDVLKAEENQPLVFTISVPVKPEVKLGKYKGVKVQKIDGSLPASELDSHINNLLDKYSEFELVTEKAAADDNFVNYSVKATEKNEPVEAWTKDHSGTKLGTAMIHEEFDDNLLGMKIDETKSFAINFPDNYQFAMAAGKTIDFEVTLKEIREKKLPELTDEFIKSISEHDTLVAYKADLKAKLEGGKSKEAEDKMRKELMENIISDSKLDVPKVMIDRELENIMKRLDMNLRSSGLNLENYIKFSGKNIDALKEEYRGSALYNVQSELISELIAKEEKIAPTEAEIDIELEKLAQAYKTDFAHVKKNLSENESDYITHYLTYEKTLKFLMDNAKIVK